MDDLELDDDDYDPGPPACLGVPDSQCVTRPSFSEPAAPSTSQQTLSNINTQAVDTVRDADVCVVYPEEGNTGIPGPAGHLLAALEKGALPENLADISQGLLNRKAATFLAPHDTAFQSPLWLEACRRCNVDPAFQRVPDNLDTAYSLRSLEGAYARKAQMLVVIDDLRPTANGDAFVTLKDPTGTAKGTIAKACFLLHATLGNGSVVTLVDTVFLHMLPFTYACIVPANLQTVHTATSQLWLLPGTDHVLPVEDAPRHALHVSSLTTPASHRTQTGASLGSLSGMGTISTQPVHPTAGPAARSTARGAAGRRSALPPSGAHSASEVDVELDFDRVELSENQTLPLAHAQAPAAPGRPPFTLAQTLAAGQARPAPGSQVHTQSAVREDPASAAQPFPAHAPLARSQVTTAPSSNAHAPRHAMRAAGATSSFESAQRSMLGGQPQHGMRRGGEPGPLAQRAQQVSAEKRSRPQTVAGGAASMPPSLSRAPSADQDAHALAPHAPAAKRKKARPWLERLKQVMREPRGDQTSMVDAARPNGVCVSLGHDNNAVTGATHSTDHLQPQRPKTIAHQASAVSDTGPDPAELSLAERIFACSQRSQSQRADATHTQHAPLPAQVPLRTQGHDNQLRRRGIHAAATAASHAEDRVQPDTPSANAPSRRTVHPVSKTRQLLARLRAPAAAATAAQSASPGSATHAAPLTIASADQTRAHSKVRSAAPSTRAATQQTFLPCTHAPFLGMPAECAQGRIAQPALPNDMCEPLHNLQPRCKSRFGVRVTNGSDKSKRQALSAAARLALEEAGLAYSQESE